MITLPKITIITPSYNQGAYIQETILSILDQNYPNLEYWVIDGGSTDQTLDILKSFDGRINWVSEPDRGQSHAINKGLQIATGDVIAYLNSDDLYEPGALRAVGEFFASHPEAAWLTGICRTVDQNGREIRKMVTAYKKFWLRTRSYPVLCVLDYISQPATFWRREVIESVGLFDESWHYAMDYDYSLRVGKQYKLWYLAVTLASFRVHPASKGTTATQEHFAADLAIAKRHTPSKFIHFSHALHNYLIVSIYRLLNS